jgi:lipoprotein-anchoring transpeptidase ErfK/SrfK
MIITPRISPAFAFVLFLAGSVGEAAAQYYPPGPIYSQDPYQPRGAYRVPPPDADDEFEYPPGVYGAPGARDPYRRGPGSSPYPYDPPPSDRRVERQPLPAPDTMGSLGSGPVGPGPYRPPFGGPNDERLSNDGVPGMRRGDPRSDDGLPVIRPPSGIGSTGGNRAPMVIEPDRAPTAGTPERGSTIASLPPDYQPEEGAPKELPQHLRRQFVPYVTTEPAGTVVIDTPNTYLYYVLGNRQAVRYGIGVGREGFTWAGIERISKMTEWPDWYPPKEMIERQPYLPRMMAGGSANPLGARALYLGKSIYRIHGTNQPSTIGQFVSSGCIRMLNDDVEDLFRRVQVGTRIVVLSREGRVANIASGSTPSSAAASAIKSRQGKVSPRKSAPQATVSRAAPVAPPATPAVRQTIDPPAAEAKQKQGAARSAPAAPTTVNE